MPHFFPPFRIRLHRVIIIDRAARGDEVSNTGAMLSRLNLHLGKAIGAALGWLLAGWPGAGAGLLVGWLLDRALHLELHAGMAWRGCGLVRADQLFYSALFATCGHLAKVDGRVSETEIRAVEDLMGELGVTGGKRRRAIRLFTAGKLNQAPWRRLLKRFRRVSQLRPERRERLLNLLLRIACADGQPTMAEHRVLVLAARDLGVPRTRLEDFIRRRQQQHRRSARSRSVKPSLSSAYRLLEVAETASVAEIKRAYRRAVSRNHPDRVLAQGLGEEQVQAAAQRTHEIRVAYEEIRRVRGF